MASYDWMPRNVAKFIAENPNVSISMPVRSSRQILEWVAADRLDFGVVLAVQGYPQVEVEELLRIPLVCLFPKESGLEDRDQITRADLNNKTVVQLRSFDQWQESSERILEGKGDFQPKSLVETYVTQAAAQIAKASRGCALIDLMSALEMVDDTMCWRPFEGEEVFSVHLARPVRQRRASIANFLIEQIRTDAQALQQKFEQLVKA